MSCVFVWIWRHWAFSFCLDIVLLCVSHCVLCLIGYCCMEDLEVVNMHAAAICESHGLIAHN